MEKYLFIAENAEGADAAGEAVLYPLSRLKVIKPITNATSAELVFEPMKNVDGVEIDTITVTYSSDFTFKQFCDGLADLFRKGKNQQFINICDSDNLTDMLTSTSCADGAITIDS